MAINAKKLYVGNLDPAVDEYAIVKLFEPYGKITFLDYLFHWTGPKKGLPRGYCFLEYNTRQQALNAIDALHGKVIKGRPLVVSFAVMPDREESLGGKGSSSSRTHRVNAVTNLRAQKMASASTDAKISAIERKLAALQKRSSKAPTGSEPPCDTLTERSTTTHVEQSTAKDNEYLDTHHPMSHRSSSKRYRPY